MAYEQLNETQVISLGGVSQKTGKKNPTELEGYYLGSELRPNKFNPDKPKNFYKFQTASGEVGIYASAGLDKIMQGARVGLMTKVTDTGKTRDVGKGNPMKIFSVAQDKTNVIDVGGSNTITPNDYSDDEIFDDEDGSTDEVAPIRARAPLTTTNVPGVDAQANLRAKLAKTRTA